MQNIPSSTNEVRRDQAGLSAPLSGHWPQLLAAMRQLMQASELHSRYLIRACGLTVPQVLVLRAIQDLERPTVGRISQAVSLSAPTVTTILNRLEERGLVTRDRGATDRRQIFLSLTARGREVLAAAPGLLPEAFVSEFQGLADWEQSLLLSSLQRLSGMLGAAVAAGGEAAGVGRPLIAG